MLGLKKMLGILAFWGLASLERPQVNHFLTRLFLALTAKNPSLSDMSTSIIAICTVATAGSAEIYIPPRRWSVLSTAHLEGFIKKPRWRLGKEFSTTDKSNFSK